MSDHEKLLDEKGIPKSSFEDLVKYDYLNLPQAIKDIVESHIENSEELSLDINDFNDEERSDLWDFIGRDDLDKSRNIEILQRDDKKFEDAEAIIIYKEELFYRARKKDGFIIHNETLGTDNKMKMEFDEALSIRKKDIVSVSVSRPSLCKCPSCEEKRDGGAQPEQAAYFELEIFTTSPKVLCIRIYDRDMAFELQDYLRWWIFDGK